jgi:hypothetical protein
MIDPEAEYDLEGVRRSPLPWVIAVVAAVAAMIGVYVANEHARDARAQAALAARDAEQANTRARELEAANRSLEATVHSLEIEQRRLTAAPAAPQPPTKARPMKRALKKRSKRR